ncbi:MAG: hypothetical protein ACLU9S_05360 [Oscillospiraceae bacterium]
MIRQQGEPGADPNGILPLRTIDPNHPLLTDPACERRMFEFNTYECRPGQLSAALELVEKQLFPRAQQFAEWTIAYLTGDSGLSVSTSCAPTARCKAAWSATGPCVRIPSTARSWRSWAAACGRPIL